MVAKIVSEKVVVRGVKMYELNSFDGILSDEEVLCMKRALYTLISRGIRTVPIEAFFITQSRKGHVLLRDVSTPAGVEDHVWVNWRALPYDFIPPKPGDQIRFIADLQVYRQRDGSQSVRLECLRELEVLR